MNLLQADMLAEAMREIARYYVIDCFPHCGRHGFCLRYHGDMEYTVIKGVRHWYSIPQPRYATELEAWDDLPIELKGLWIESRSLETPPTH